MATYGTRYLPGRLVVEKGAQVGTAFRAAAFDLTTAQRTVLPMSARPDGDNWWASSNLLLRVRTGTDETLIDLFRDSDFTLTRTVSLPASVRNPRLSPDGKQLLAFSGRTLTIFDATDGHVVDTTDAFDDQIVIGMPATWLADGSYAFLLGKTLYRARPGAAATELATLALVGPTPSSVLNNDLAASPDGRRLAISWRDLDSEDADLWVVEADGSDLRRLTRSPASALEFTHANPTWSPDSRWVAAALYMSGTSSAPTYPDEPFLGDRIIGSTGCIDQVFVVPAEGPTVELDWPSFDATYGLKVAAPSGRGGQWLSTCGGELGWLR